MKTSRQTDTTPPTSGGWGRPQGAPRTATPQLRRGFTLVELLVAVAVLLVLAALTLAAFAVASEEDVPEGARSGQSFTEGARDRAIYRKRPVGVRLLLDPNGTQNGAGNSVVASSLQYISSPTETLKGLLVIDPTTGTATPADEGRIITNAPPPAQQATIVWETIRNNRGLINHGIQMPIRIVVNTSTGATEDYLMGWSEPKSSWVLTKDYGGTVGEIVPYELELLPAVMANQQIREMPREAVINLPDSKIPSFWYNPASSSYIAYLDILFSPRGTGIGSASGSGMIHLHVCSPEDRERVEIQASSYNLAARIATPIAQVMGNPRNKNSERIISINPVTGNISVSDVPKFADADQDDVPDSFYDPFLFAEFGVTAQ